MTTCHSNHTCEAQRLSLAELARVRPPTWSKPTAQHSHRVGRQCAQSPRRQTVFEIDRLNFRNGERRALMSAIILSLLSSLLGLLVGFISIYIVGIEKGLIPSVRSQTIYSFCRLDSIHFQVVLSVTVFLIVYAALLSGSLQVALYGAVGLVLAWFWLCTFRTWTSKLVSLVLLVAGSFCVSSIVHDVN